MCRPLVVKVDLSSRVFNETAIVLPLANIDGN